jgi:3-oxoacyl-[acyl-carrier protein] reductase/pteridine reductase
MVRLLEGKTILITGAAIRIGRSLAISAAQQGANIIIHYGKSKIDAEKTLSDVEKFGVKAKLVHADLNETDQVSAIIPNSLVFF